MEIQVVTSRFENHHNGAKDSSAWLEVDGRCVTRRFIVSPNRAPDRKWSGTGSHNGEGFLPSNFGNGWMETSTWSLTPEEFVKLYPEFAQFTVAGDMADYNRGWESAPWATDQEGAKQYFARVNARAAVMPEAFRRGFNARRLFEGVLREKGKFSMSESTGRSKFIL